MTAVMRQYPLKYYQSHEHYKKLNVHYIQTLNITGNLK